MNVVPLSGRTGSGRSTSTQNDSTIAALDVGSTKVCCLIAEHVPAKDKHGSEPSQSAIKIKGMGHRVAHGIRSGVVVDVEAAERSIRAAVDRAERTAGVTIDGVYVNVSGGRPGCIGSTAHVGLGDGQVTPAHIQTALQAARSRIDTQGRTLLHTAPVSYTLDANKGVRQPVGMFGETFGVDVNAITVDPGPMRNLATCIERCHLNIHGFVISPYASARAVLVEDELDLGVTCIDMGGGTTSVSVFVEGNLLFADVIPIGGAHVTNDIARGLSTPVAHAERMKTLHGSALPSMCDDREMVPVPAVGERGRDTVSQLPKSMLTGIIQPRIEETFELIRDRLRASGFARLAGRRAVLTGGASQITGARELAASTLDLQVRLGYPHRYPGIPEKAKGPAFAVTGGLLDYAANPDAETVSMPDMTHSAGHAMHAGYFARVGRWIKDSF